MHFSDVGWTDITSTTATASVILTALGYGPDTSILSVPVTYAGLSRATSTSSSATGCPPWRPTSRPAATTAASSCCARTSRAPSTLSPSATASPRRASRDFADIAKFGDDLDWKIYGIEPGNDGNRPILDMIEKDAFGLGKFELVESSEQAMLAEAKRAQRSGKGIVFLGWEPHPMNQNVEMTYLTGGDDFFGPNFGGATVYTNVRKGLVEECPNLGKLLNNLGFTLDMENAIMGSILDEGEDPEAAASAWLEANPDALGPWLEGVTTFDGQDGPRR